MLTEDRRRALGRAYFDAGVTEKAEELSGSWLNADPGWGWIGWADCYLLWQSGFSASCDAGRYRDAAAVRAQIRRITSYVGPDEDLDAAWCSAFRPDPDVTGLLTRYPGSRRGVFTDNGPLEEDVLTRLTGRLHQAATMRLGPDELECPASGEHVEILRRPDEHDQHVAPASRAVSRCAAMAALRGGVRSRPPAPSRPHR